MSLHAPQLVPAKVAPVDLGLFTRFRLVSDGKSALTLRPKRLHEILQDCVAAFVTLAADLSQNDLGIRHAIIYYTLSDVLLVRVKLRRPLRLRTALVTARGTFF